MEHFVYILYSAKLNRFYTGYTADIDRRLVYHKDAVADNFTYRANDWVLEFTIHCVSKSQALAIERHIKKMKSKGYIQNIMKYPEIVLKLKERYS